MSDYNNLPNSFYIKANIKNSAAEKVQIVGMKCFTTTPGDYAYYGPSSSPDMDTPVEIDVGETKQVSFRFQKDDENGSGGMGYAIGYNFNPNQSPNIYLYGKGAGDFVSGYHVKENLILDNISSNVKFDPNQTLVINITEVKYTQSGSGGSSGSSSGSSGSAYSNVPTVEVSGWESYPKGKRIELMHTAIVPSATDSYLYSTRYFEFAGVVTDFTLSYIGENIDTTADRYVFYEITEDEYLQGLAGSNPEDFYKIEGPFSGLGITDYRFDPSGQQRNGTINGNRYLGTTSEPQYIDWNNVPKKNLHRLLQIVQEVGDTAGRQPLFDANYGRVRPLGNPAHPDVKLRKASDPYIGNPWNGFSNNTLKARSAESQETFYSYISSDEVHADNATSYPSGHSAQFWAIGSTIVQLYGAKYGNDKDQNAIKYARKYINRAYRIGVERTIGRFHWNSDTLYGKLIGSMIMPILNSSYSSNFNDNLCYFNELINSAGNELFSGYSSFNKITSFPEISTADPNYNNWFNDFKNLVNRITSTSGVGPIINDDLSNGITRYLWNMYEAGRTELNASNKFGFFTSETTNYYPGKAEDQYYEDIDDYDGWFPEVFNTSQKITPEKDGTSETIKYHGENTSYECDPDLKNHEILCSWLMAMCLAELNISTSGGDPNNINNQTKLFATAYEICGGRSLSIYDDYAIDHDPMYLRLAAGIIYCFERGQFDDGLIDSIRSGARIQLDTDNVFGIEPAEANDVIGNDAERVQFRNDGYVAGDKVFYGIDNYYIFPNAPGPYKNGRLLSRPFEKNPSKPGSAVLKTQCQDSSQFIVGSESSGGSGGSGSDEVATDKIITITVNITYMGIYGASIDDYINFVLANPNKQGKYYGYNNDGSVYKGSYNREKCKLVGESFLLDRGTPVSFTVTGPLGDRSPANSDAVAAGGRASNVLLYVNGVSESLTCDMMDTDIVFEDGGTYDITVR